jgi:hypothetical protein
MTTKPEGVDPLEKSPKITVKQRASSFCPPLKYKVLSDEEINLTKEAAYKFLELTTFVGERAVRERHVQFLFDEWSANRFLWQNIIIASAKVAGRDEEYRINGQHTCWMRVHVPERYEPLDCRVRVMCYQVADEEQLRTLYSVFDRGAPRTQGHIGQVILLGTKAGEGVPKRLFGLLVSGFKLFWDQAGRRANLSMNDWCGLIENNYGTLFNVVGRWAGGHIDATRHMKRAAVVAAMFATFEKNVQASDEFWGRVADGINLPTKTDPRYQLRNYLLTHGHSIVSGLEKVSQEEVVCVCLNLWNHWRNNESVTTVKGLSERPKVHA